MAIVFKEDTEASFDGVHIRTYTKGVAYEAKHPMEAIIFEHFMATGKASQAKDMNVEASPSLPPQTKIRRPAQKKSE
jgi:hypothetical protein